MGSTGPMFKVSKFKTNVSTETWLPSLTGSSSSSFQSSSRHEEVTTTTTTKSTTSSAGSMIPISIPVRTTSSSRSPCGDSGITDRHQEHQHEINSDGKMEESTSYFKSSDSYYQQDGYLSSDERSRLKILEPPEENMDIILARKKMFSSSSFYEEPHHIYPTMEEQVDLCRKIADSLSDDTNKLSRGHSMYNRRKQRAEKWVFEGPDPESETNPTKSELANRMSSPNRVDGGKSGLGRSHSAPQRRLKLVLDPRELQDAMKLRNSGLYNEHNVVSPDICLDLVRDLNSPTGKGAALFAKRKKKSEKWIVDENTVKQHEHHVETEIIHNDDRAAAAATAKQLRNLGSGFLGPGPPSNLLQPRLKLIKSPWEAALESPIGCCDAAFQEVLPGFKGLGADLAQTVLRRAEQRWSLTQDQLPSSNLYPYLRPGSNPDVYKPRGPRGWDGGFSAARASSPDVRQESPIPEVYVTPVTTSSTSTSTAPANWSKSSLRFCSGQPLSAWSTLNQFANFNNSPRSWIESGTTPTSKSRFRSVRPSTSACVK